MAFDALKSLFKSTTDSPAASAEQQVRGKARILRLQDAPKTRAEMERAKHVQVEETRSELAGTPLTRAQMDRYKHEQGLEPRFELEGDFEYKS